MLREGQCGWFFQAIPALLLSATISTSSDAQALRFGPGGAGGSGTWDNATANWFNGSTTVPWASGAVALFGGTAGTVTASGTVAASGITFSTNGYTITGGTLALSGIAPVVTTNAGVSTTINSLLTGPSVLVKSGAGTLTLGNASNAYTGGTIVSQGSLVFGGNSALGTGTVTLGDVNTGASNVSLLANFPNFSTGQTIQNNIIVSGSGSGIVSIGSTSFNPGSNGTIYSGTITLNRDLTIIGGNADRTSFIGKITGSGNITLTGSRITFDNSSNDFIGNVTISSGSMLQTNAANVLPKTTTLNILGNGVLRFVNTGDQTIDGLNGSSSAGMTYLAGGPPKLAVGASNGSGVYSGQIGNVISSFTKLGTGTQVLSGANTYLGVTRISGGLLSTQLLANGGVASGIGASSNAAANLVLDGGRLQYTGAGANTDRQFTLTTNGGGLDASGSGAVNFTSTAAVALGGAGPRTFALAGSSTAANTLNAVLGESGGASSLLKTGIGRWVLTGNQSYTGETTIAQGTLALSGAASVANSARVVADGTLDISAVTPASASIRSLAGGGTVALGVKTLTLTNANDTFAGSITGAGGLTVSAGTETLTGMSNYTGATNVSGTGTLQLLNGGQITGTSGIQVGGLNSSAMATVSGTGSLLQTAGGLTVGINGGSNATVNVLNGGVVRTAGAATLGGVGSQAGTINVDGAGSLLDIAGGLNVGTVNPAISAVLNVANGGTVRSLSSTVGSFASGAGTKSVLISGSGSSWTMSGAFNLQANASVSILNGGTVNAATSTIGSLLNGGTANLLISGVGSTFSVTGNQVVGATSGSGIVTLADGARMTVGGQLTLASSAGATGVLNLGSGEGQAASGAGMLDAATLAFGPGTGRLNFNHTDAGYV
ncbi:autotransporter-associated beta strand protein, partial [Bosea sp. OAE752]|uniref:beta strand repeat-containing protein n=1 Tax=Bosea sp. OAE752 TaxID=2663873 RepID=UPI003D20C21D